MASEECAVVLTAGYGSRLFPVTSVVPKSLMPIGRYPVVHHVLADLVAAGVSDVAVVVGAGEDGVRRYVRGDPDVARGFEQRGWSTKYAAVQRVHDELSATTFTFTEQDLHRGDYGTAVPARLAADFIGDRNCLYLSGDDLLLDPDADRNTADLNRLRVCGEDAAAVMQVTRIDPSQAHRYGLAPDEASGELMTTTALQAVSRRHPVGVSVAAGQYFDCGSTDGWLAANVATATRP